MTCVYDDGGRKAAGFRGTADDCVCRAIAIVTGRAYADVYRALNVEAQTERYARGRVGRLAATKRGSSARTGMLKPTYKAYLSSLGFRWTPTMKIGSGCVVHLRDGELPMGRLLVSVSKHLTAVIDGVIYDTHDPSRNGTRCVYGYWVQ